MVEKALRSSQDLNLGLLSSIQMLLPTEPLELWQAVTFHLAWTQAALVWSEWVVPLTLPRCYTRKVKVGWWKACQGGNRERGTHSCIAHVCDTKLLIPSSFSSLTSLIFPYSLSPLSSFISVFDDVLCVWFTSPVAGSILGSQDCRRWRQASQRKGNFFLEVLVLARSWASPCPVCDWLQIKEEGLANHMNDVTWIDRDGKGSVTNWTHFAYSFFLLWTSKGLHI